MIYNSVRIYRCSFIKVFRLIHQQEPRCVRRLILACVDCYIRSRLVLGQVIRTEFICFFADIVKFVVIVIISPAVADCLQIQLNLYSAVRYGNSVFKTQSSFQIVRFTRIIFFVAEIKIDFITRTAEEIPHCGTVFFIGCKILFHIRAISV